MKLKTLFIIQFTLFIALYACKPKHALTQGQEKKDTIRTAQQMDSIRKQQQWDSMMSGLPYRQLFTRDSLSKYKIHAAERCYGTKDCDDKDLRINYYFSMCEKINEVPNVVSDMFPEAKFWKMVIDQRIPEHYTIKATYNNFFYELPESFNILYYEYYKGEQKHTPEQKIEAAMFIYYSKRYLKDFQFGKILRKDTILTKGKFQYYNNIKYNDKILMCYYMYNFNILQDCTIYDKLRNSVISGVAFRFINN